MRGHADACLEAIGVASTSQAVAGLYEDFLDGWLVSEGDAAPGPTGRLAVEARPLLMSSVEATADIAGAAVDLGTRLAARVRA